VSSCGLLNVVEKEKHKKNWEIHIINFFAFGRGVLFFFLILMQKQTSKTEKKWQQKKKYE
jgi:hypothetical protein